MTRNGKIARLPHDIREKLNRRLRDNVPGTKICEWVNRLPACRKVCAEFARRSGRAKSPVTVNQLSEWRRGGYQDWLREQQVLEETRELRQWCAKLGRNGGDITEGVATLLSGQLLRLVQGMGKLQASKRPSSRELRIADCGLRNGPQPGDPGSAAVTAASSGGVSPPETGTGTVHQPAGGDPSSRGYDATGACATSLRLEDPRSGAEDVEWMESSVGLMRELVKCLSGIRRGDHNRVRLAQSEKKLALRSELVSITVEKYEKEKAEQEELARKEREAERHRKQSPVFKLSDEGTIDLYRGRTFGPDHIIRERETELAEREKETKRLQMELEILKAEMPPSTRASNSNATNESPSLQAPSVQRSSNDQVPSSKVTAAPVAAASSGRESIRVNTSAYDQSEGKDVGGGGQGAEVSTQRRKDAETQGSKIPVPAWMVRRLEQLKKDQAAFIAELQANGSFKRRTSPISSGQQGGSDCLDADELLRELDQLSEELAAVSAELGFSSGGSATGIQAPMKPGGGNGMNGTDAVGSDMDKSMNFVTKKELPVV